jgi:putative transcriptional regulator
MSKAYQSIKQGILEAIDYASGKPIAAVVHQPRTLDIKSLRQQIGMNQIEFAATLGITVNTLRHWERGDRTPRGSALVLLKAVANDSKAVLKALSR